MRDVREAAIAPGVAADAPRPPALQLPLLPDDVHLAPESRWNGAFMAHFGGIRPGSVERGCAFPVLSRHGHAALCAGGMAELPAPPGRTPRCRLCRKGPDMTE